MAGYSYAGLRIPVRADTTGFENAVKRSAATAADAAGKSLSSAFAKASESAGRALSSNMDKATRGVERQFSRAGQGIAKSLTEATRTSGGLFEKALSAALGGAGRMIGSALMNTVRPWAVEAGKRTAAQMFLEMEPALRRGIDRAARQIGNLTAAAIRTGSAIVSTLGGALLKIAAFAGNMWRQIQSGAGTAADMMRRAAGVVASAWGGLARLGPVLASALSRAFTVVAQAAGAAVRAITAGFSGVGRLGAPIVSGLAGAFTAAVRAAGTAARAVVSAFASLPGAARAGQAIVTGLSRAFSAVVSAAGVAVRSIASAFASIPVAGEPIVAGMSRAFSLVVNAAGAAASAVVTAFGAIPSLGGPIVAGLSRAFSTVAQAASGAARVMSNAFGAVITGVRQVAGQIALVLSVPFRAIGEAAQRAAQTVATHWNGVISGARQVAVTITQAFASIAQVVTRVMSSIANVTGKAARIFGKEFLSAAATSSGAFADIAAAAGQASQAVQNASSTAGDSAAGAAQAAGQAAANAAQTFASGFLDAAASSSKSVLGLVPAVDDVGSAAERTAAKVAAVTGVLKEMGSSFGSAISSAATIAGSSIIGIGVSAAKTGVGFNTMSQSARVAFETMLGSRDAANDMINRITEFAQSSPFPREAFIQGTQQMIAFGVATDKAIPYQNALQDAVAAAGGTAQDLSELTLVMGQIQAAGKITGVDLMQFGRHGIQAAELIGNAMGKTGAEIKEEISGGSFEATRALDALASGMDKRFGGAASNLKTTWVGATDTVHAAMRQIGAAIIEPFISEGGGGLAVEWANRLSKAMKGLVPAVKPLASAFARLVAPAADKLIGLIERLSTGIKNTPTDVLMKRLKALVPVIGLAGGAFTLMAGNALQGIPVIGNLLTGLTGPFKVVGKQAGQLGMGFAKELLPSMGGFGKTVAGVMPEAKGLGTIFSGLGGSMGGMVLPILAVVGAFAALMAASPKFREAIMGFVRAIFSALKPAFDAIVNGLKQIIPPVWDLIRQIGDALAPVIERLIPVLQPLGQIIGFVITMAFKTLAFYIRLLMPVLTWLINVLGKSLIIVLDFVGAAIRRAVTVFNVIKDAIVTVWHWIVGGSPGLVPAFQFLATIISSTAGFIQTVITTAFGAIRWAIQAAWNTITTGAAWAWNLLTGIITAAVNWVRTIITAGWNGMLAVTRMIWNGIVLAVQTAWNWIRTAVSAAVNFVRWLVTSAWNGLRASTAAVWNGILTVIRNAWNAIRAAVSSAVNWIRGFISGAWNAIRSATSTIWNGILSVIRNVWNAIRAAVSSAIGWIRGFVSGAWNWIRNTTSSIWNAIQGVITGAWNAIRSAISGALNWIRNLIASAWKWIKSLSAAVWNAILNGIRNVWTGIRNAVQSAVTWIGNRIRAAWEFIRTSTLNHWRGIFDGIRNVWNNIRSAVGSAVAWVQSRMQAAWTAIRNAASNAWNGILNTVKNVWEKLKETVRAPVRWVVNNVINKLINGINTLITKIGMGKIGTIQGFRTGGRIPGGWGGGDVIPAMVEPGEWVLTKEQARGIGYDRLRNLPHYQHGGPVGSEHTTGAHPAPLLGLPGWIKDIGGGIARVTGLDDLWKGGKELFDDVVGMLTFAASELFKLATEPLKKAVQPWVNHAKWFPERWGGKTVTQVIDKAIEFIASKAMGACDAGGLVAQALTFDGHRYIWGGASQPEGGWDCSSFINFIAGSAGLPLPGGFKAPSREHGPNTTMWLNFDKMTNIPYGQMQAGDIAVNNSHIILVTGPGGKGFAARGADSGTGPQNIPGGKYTIRRWKDGAGAAAGSCDPSGGNANAHLPPGGAVQRWTPIVQRMATMHGIPWTANAWLKQIQTESGGDPNARQRVMDVNMRSGDPAMGLLQIIGSTFSAFNTGPFRGRPRNNPEANIWTAMNYAIKRYGKNRITSVIGHGHGYARGGIIREPVVGYGVRTGERYEIAERGPEMITPLAGSADITRGLGASRPGVTVNVYPREGQDERAIAAAVSRELAWAQAGGAR